MKKSLSRISEFDVYEKLENYSTAHLPVTNSCRRYIADILPKRSQTLSNLSINQSNFVKFVITIFSNSFKRILKLVITDSTKLVLTVTSSKIRYNEFQKKNLIGPKWASVRNGSYSN